MSSQFIIYIYSDFDIRINKENFTKYGILKLMTYIFKPKIKNIHRSSTIAKIFSYSESQTCIILPLYFSFAFHDVYTNVTSLSRFL